MRNRFTNLSMLTGAALLTAAMAAPAQAVVVFDDSFADGDQAKTGALDTNWWTSSSSSGDEISVGTLGLVTGTSGRGLHTIFPVQTLSNVGDKIVASYTYTTPTTIDTSGGNSSALRFGLFDSLGQAGLDDHVSASSGSPNALYGWGLATGGPGSQPLPGYMLDLDVYNNSDLVAAAGADINFREHTQSNITGTGRLMATTSNFSSLTSGPDEGYVFDPNTQYTGSITIERISATEIEITGTHNGATWSQTDVFDSVNFDMFAMHANSNKFGSSNSAGDPDNGLDFSNIKVEFLPIPEPASLALVGLGGLAILRRR